MTQPICHKCSYPLGPTDRMNRHSKTEDCTSKISADARDGIQYWIMNEVAETNPDDAATLDVHQSFEAAKRCKDDFEENACVVRYDDRNGKLTFVSKLENL